MSRSFFKKLNQEAQLNKLPFIPSELYSQLPSLLQQGIGRFEAEREKDVYFIGALTVLSGCLQGVHGIYDQKKVFPNLYSFISAPAASGKGVMAYAKILGKAWAKHLNSGSDKDGKQKHFFLPANSSSAAIVDNLNHTGGIGVIFETEADTLANSFKNDWGNFSDALRNGFHHEPITSCRKGESGFVAIDTPRISVGISGTPGQLLSIFPSAENGLYSRFTNYTFPYTPEWRDVSPKEGGVSHTDFFNEQSEKVLEMVLFSIANPSEFTLSKAQWKTFNDYFRRQQADTFRRLGLGAVCITRRLALMIYRIAMIISAVRRFESKSTDAPLACNEQDFNIAMSLAGILHRHSEYIYSLLPNTEYTSEDVAMRNFYDGLPPEFSRAEAIEVAKGLKLSTRCGDGYLKVLTEEGIFEKEKQGNYRKIELITA
ncbi:DUF3987 domain-containing protein [Pontibacter sp. KCTC 32443]|uniref:DUF3987 domain-containing protein n=1 Tax=Pontibacter TaxID=323449 RepID=UPI00164E03ED|nr:MULTISPECIES: DUF3987 domain-containing protein [Pontibacter]MBC5774355.1 DUF3987 domain-containing protein [Pontibacter sp. KCTC 32443]